ncbi:hypothetical protein ACFL1X_03540 [Candidatus Hydrogenedentota bacterium]
MKVVFSTAALCLLALSSCFTSRKGPDVSALSATTDGEHAQKETEPVNDKKTEPKGAFRVALEDGRHWLITPAGERFLSLGVVHISAVAQQGKVDLFGKRFGCDWRKVSEEAFDNLRNWGFNTAGYGAPRPLREMLPFMADVFLAKNCHFLTNDRFSYPDVFDPQYQREIEEKIKKMCLANRNNDNLIGYYWTDTPHWDLDIARRKRGTDWVSAIRHLDAGAPGKKRYVVFLKQKYDGDTTKFNRVYEMEILAFDELLSEPFDGLDLESVRSDDMEFLAMIAREYYRVTGEANKRYDPEHLIFGERYLATDCPDEVLVEALPYVDVLSIQPLGSRFRQDRFERLHKLTGKPIMLCDHQCSFATPEYPRTMWKQLESEEAVGIAYGNYLEDAFARPYVIGYHRCQYIDRFAPSHGVLKQGLIREDATPYVELVEYVRKANSDLTARFLK